MKNWKKKKLKRKLKSKLNCNIIVKFQKSPKVKTSTIKDGVFTLLKIIKKLSGAM